MTAARSPHRAWIEVDHAAIRHNVAAIRGLVDGTELIAVVKANAYGHGDVAVARTLVAEGVNRLAVATVDEARRLRTAGIAVPILLLWGIGPAEVADVADLALEPILYDGRTVRWLEDAPGTGRIGVHLKLDTGLGRQGVEPEHAAELAAAVVRSRRLTLVGTMSHQAVAGDDDADT
jgi:alanine racemase